jgi:hypothetical protein
MYFFKYEKLSKDFILDAVSEYDTFKYLLASIAVQQLVIPFMITVLKLSSVMVNTANFVYVNAFITVIGISICYGTNRMYEDEDFIKRFFCLSFPIRNIVLLMVIILSLGYSFFCSMTKYEVNANALNIINSLGTFYQFYLINKCLRVIGESRRNLNSSVADDMAGFNH